MELTRLVHIPFSLALLLAFFSQAEAAGELGVAYGRKGDDLPDPASVVHLLTREGIRKLRIYDTNDAVLHALEGTGIELMVMVTDANVSSMATDPSFAQRWVQDHLVNHLAANITAVAVGNEEDRNPFLVKAMENLHRELEKRGLQHNVKVTAPLAFNVLDVSSPPSSGSFRGNIQQMMGQMLSFLNKTDSYMSVNIFPVSINTYKDLSSNIIPLDYTLGNDTVGFTDTKTNLTYHSLLDANLDAMYFAMEKMGFDSVSLAVTETGMHSHFGRGHPPPLPTVSAFSSLAAAATPSADEAALIPIAQAYINYIINRMLAGRTGTPHRPNADMDVYIFSLFNENKKYDDAESHYGLFYPNMTKVYEFDFRGGMSPVSWCNFNAANFEPNNKRADASNPFTNHYFNQMKGQTSLGEVSTCDGRGWRLCKR